MALVAGDDEYCNAAAGQVLLVRDPLIGGDQQLVSVAFSLVEQFAVSERVPVALKGGVRWWSGRLNVSSLGTLLSSSILIFEVLLQGVDFVVEDGYDLLERDAFEVVQELVDGRAVFESFEKRGDG